MTTVEALKEYYVAIGGKSADVATVDTIPEMIQAITKIVSTTKSDS